MLKVVYVLRIVGTVDNHEILNKNSDMLEFQEQIIDGAKVAHDNHIGTYCIVMKLVDTGAIKKLIILVTL